MSIVFHYEYDATLKYKIIEASYVQRNTFSTWNLWLETPRNVQMYFVLEIWRIDIKSFCFKSITQKNC